MWNKRRDEEPLKPFSPQVPQSVAPIAASVPAPVTHPVEVKKEITPVSSTPVSRFEPANSGNSIGKSVKVVGQIYSKEDLFVDRGGPLHFSHERHLANRIRRQFGFRGTPILIETRPKRAKGKP